MLLKEIDTGCLVEVLDLPSLFDPFKADILGQESVGEEPQDPSFFSKSELAFASGEPLPRCWVDPNYRGVSTCRK